MDRIYPHYTSNIKRSTLESINQWIEFGVPPGDFLEAVLKNKLKESIMYADSDNLEALPNIVKYLYNSCPAACWGSEEKFNNWIDFKIVERNNEGP